MTILIGSELDDVVELAGALPAELIGIPTLPEADLDWTWAEPLQDWRERTAADAPADAIVVAAWGPVHGEAAFAELGLERWLADGEQRLAVWAAALAAAVRRCNDGGTVVAVVDRVSTLDGPGHAVLQMVADGVEGLVKSLSRGEGRRGVRVNAVTTPARQTPPTLLNPPVPLDGFPGRVGREVAGAVRVLLAPGGEGLTGRILDVDLGRSWR